MKFAGAVKKFIVRILLVFASLVITLGLLEGVLQLMDYPPDPSRARTRVSYFRPTSPYMEFDPTYGWRDKANSEIDLSDNNQKIHLKFNSRGLRGREYAYSKPPGTYRILIVGDSFVEGYGVKTEDRVSEQLEKLLNDGNTGQPVEVIAMGTAGYSTDQELLALQREGLRYHPDLVILMFYQNDVFHNIVSRTGYANKPLYASENGKLVLTNVPLSKTIVIDPNNNPGSSRHQSFYSRSKLYLLIVNGMTSMPALRQFGEKLGIRPHQSGGKQAGSQADFEEKLDLFKTEETRETVEAWQMTRLLLRSMNNTVESAGARFIIFHIPIKVSIYTNKWEKAKSQLSSDDTYDINKVAADLKSLCDEERLEFIEPTEQFIEAGHRLKKEHLKFLYFQSDPHWTPSGHRVAAEILAKYIRNK
jgi:hypothetical protein